MADRRRTPVRPSGPHGLGVIVAVLLGLGFGGASGMTTGYLLRSEEGLAGATEHLAPRAPLPFLAARELSTPVTLLVMGVDATGEQGRSGLRANSDTMLLLRLAPDEGRLYALSLPRDTRVRIPGHGVFKINAAQAWGGPDLAARTVSNFLDLSVHRYLVVSLSGVIKAIDAIGGLDVTIPKAMDYDDWAGGLHVHLKPGLQRLSGAQVEAYVRFRKDDIGSDVARVQRQQAFLMETGRQLLGPRVVLRIPELWSILGSHAQTNLSIGEMMRIARWARRLDAGRDVTMTVLPGDYTMLKGVSFWTADLDGIASFLNAHFRDRPAPDHWAAYAERRVRPRVVVWDATGRHPRLRPLERQLRQAGYVVWAVGRRKSRSLASRIIVQRGDVEGGRDLAGTLALPEIYAAGVGDLNSDFTVELGEDWQGDSPPAVAGAPHEAPAQP